MTTIALDLLDPATRNANRMDDELMRQLVENMSSDPGATLQPVLLRPKDGGRFEIVDGHHRVAAARLAGWKAIDTVVRDMTDEQAARTAIAMNRIRGELDLAIVGDIFAVLSDTGVDPALLAATGFSPEEVDSLIEAATSHPDDEEHPVAIERGGQAEPAEERETWELEVSFADRKDRDRVRRVAKKLGAGEPAAGLLRLVEAEEGEGDLEELLEAAQATCGADPDKQAAVLKNLQRAINRITKKRKKGN
jgi:ParB-like chromosome segregation protein Spo0J